MLRDRILKRVEATLKKERLPIGVRLWNGDAILGAAAPRITLTLNSPSALKLFINPNLSALAESYLKQEIDIEGEIQDIIRLLAPVFRGSDQSKPRAERFTLFRHNRERDSRAIRHHYDVSNDFYALWLDRQRVYSCAYFRSPDDSLDLAQAQKIDHLCKKLRLQPGDRLLDIGCGWGALILWAAEKYGVNCVGITLSEQQHSYASEHIAARGLAKRVEVRLQDYRDVPEDQPFDKIVSVGMFEHVGARRLSAYFAKIHRLLRPGGVAMNHGITSASLGGERTSTGNEFIEKYIFPDGELVHVSKVMEIMAREGLEVLDVESLRRHYAQTLWHWVTRLEANSETAKTIVGEERYRAWRAYLGGFAYAFEQGWDNLYQILAAKPLANGSLDYPMTRDHIYGA